MEPRGIRLLPGGRPRARAGRLRPRRRPAERAGGGVRADHRAAVVGSAGYRGQRRTHPRRGTCNLPPGHHRCDIARTAAGHRGHDRHVRRRHMDSAGARGAARHHVLLARGDRAAARRLRGTAGRAAIRRSRLELCRERCAARATAASAAAAALRRRRRHRARRRSGDRHRCHLGGLAHT